MPGPLSQSPYRRALLCLALLVAFAWQAAPASAAYDEAVSEQGTIGHTGFASGGSLAAPPLSTKWSRNLGTSTSYPLIAGGKVFVVASDSTHSSSTLFGLDGATGETVWSRPVGLGARIAYDSGRVFAVDGTTTVTSVDAGTGLTLWVKPLNSNSTPNAPVAVDGRVYVQVPAAYDPLYALDEADGTVLWQNTRLTTGGSPAVDGRNVYVAGPSCTSTAVNRVTGRTAWLRQPPGCGSSPRWAVADGSRSFSNGFVFGASSGEYRDQLFGGQPAIAGSTGVSLNGKVLQARDVRTGVLDWEYTGDGNLASVPTIVNGTAYVGSNRGELVAVDTATGLKTWSSQLIPAVVAYDQTPYTVGRNGMAAGGGLLVAPVGGTVFALSSAAPAVGTDLRISAGPDGPTTATTAAFAFSATGAGFSYKCRLDGGDWTTCAASASYDSVADGHHIFEVKTVSGSGDDIALASRGWSVYTVELRTKILTSPPALTNSYSAKFTFSTTGNAGMECRVDGYSWSDCSTGSYENSPSSGDHLFEVRGSDTLGRTDDPPVAYRWTIDRTSPSISLDAGPSGSTTSRSAEFRFSSTDSTARFECQLDAAPYASCTSPTTYSGLANGNHTFSVRAIDPAGNISDSYYNSRSWTVTDPPTVPDTTITAQPGLRSPSSSGSFGFSSTGGTSFECKLDSESWSTCSSPRYFYSLSDGSHVFQVRASNSAGTDLSPASYNWTIDTVAPETTIDEAPSGTTASRTGQAKFSSADATARFECSLDDATYAACTSPQPFTGLSAGTHTFRARAIDPTGNADTTPAARTWTVADPPETTITAAPVARTKSSSASFEFSSSPSGATFECRLDGAAAWSACSSPDSRVALTDGQHTFEVRATSSGLTDPTPASHTWTVDTQAPETTIDTAASGPVGSDGAHFVFTSNDTPSTFECQMDTRAYANCSSPMDYAGLTPGDHTFRVRAADSLGNVDATPATMAFVLVPGNPPGTATVAPPVRTDTLTKSIKAYAVSVAQTFSRAPAPRRGRATRLLIRFDAPRAGLLSAGLTMRSGGRTVVLGRISRRFRARESARAEIKLTSAGRAALASHHRTKLSVTVSFTPSDRTANGRATVGVTRFPR